MTKPVILLAEDRPVQVQGVKDACGHDFDIVVATRIADAMMLFVERRKVLFAAVMDGCLEHQHLDTEELTKHFHKMEPTLPIVAYSSDPRINARLRIAGCQYEIEKNPVELFALLVNLINSKK